MSKLRVEGFSISLDGFGAGPNQDTSNPLGVGGPALHGGAMSTRTIQKAVFGGDGGSTGTVDDNFAARGFRNIGAWLRIMFGIITGSAFIDRRTGCLRQSRDGSRFSE